MKVIFIILILIQLQKCILLEIVTQNNDLQRPISANKSKYLRAASILNCDQCIRECCDLDTNLCNSSCENSKQIMKSKLSSLVMNNPINLGPKNPYDTEGIIMIVLSIVLPLTIIAIVILCCCFVCKPEDDEVERKENLSANDSSLNQSSTNLKNKSNKELESSDIENKNVEKEMATINDDSVQSKKNS